MMIKAIRFVMPAFALAVIAGPLSAGTPVLTIGNPDASAQARAMHVVLTIKPGGCLATESTAVTGTAIGIVNGERRSIPLKLIELSDPGLYGVTQQWPAEGNWVLQFTATDGARTAGALVPAGPNGVERSKARLLARQATPSDIDSVLNDHPAAIAQK